MLKSWQFHLSVRELRAVGSALLVVTLLALSSNLTSLAVAQPSGAVPVNIRQAIGDALGDGSSNMTSSNTALEPGPLRLDIPENATPTRAKPLDGINPPMITGPIVIAPPLEGATVEPETLIPPTGPERSSNPSMSVPVAITKQRLRQAASQGQLSDLHGDLHGGAPDDAIGLMPPSSCAWKEAGPIPWQAFAQGGYVGPARTAHTPEYRLRIDDTIEFVYRATRQATLDHYRVQAGDTLRVEVAGALERSQDEVTVQPDGQISLAYVGEVRAADRTMAEIGSDLNQLLSKEMDNPQATVSAVRLNTEMQELGNTADNPEGIGGQSRRARVTAAGTVQLPVIGSIPAQGLSLSELKREIEAAYASIIPGLEVTPILEEPGPSSIHVLGAVKIPGRYELHGPTSAMQGVALAGGSNPAANLRQVIVFRRANNWKLTAAQLDLHAASKSRKPFPAGEVWLRDSDIVVVPEGTIRAVSDVMEPLLSAGACGVTPLLAHPTLTTL